LVTRLASEKDAKKGGRTKALKRDAMLDMLKSAITENLAPSCNKCGCKDFVPNAFNREKCNTCFHTHTQV